MRAVPCFMLPLLCIVLGNVDAAQRETPPTLAVLDLATESIPAAEVQMLSERLRVHLFNTGHFRLLEREHMLDILKEQSFQQSGCVATSCAVEVGQLLGVEKMVAGSVERVASFYSLNARLVDVETGQIERISFDDCIGCSFEDVLSGSTTQVVGALTGVPAGAPAVDQRGSSARLPSPENMAVQLALTKLGYSVGAVDGVRGSQTKVAIKAFQAANGLTPDGVVGIRTAETLARRLTELSATELTRPSSATTAGQGTSTPALRNYLSEYQYRLAPAGSPGTVYVHGYYRKDGTYVRPHYRSAPGAASSGSSYSDRGSSSSSSSGSGTVYVRGYYRKDGTYVRPHTRRRPSK